MVIWSCRFEPRMVQCIMEGAHGGGGQKWLLVMETGGGGEIAEFT